MLSVYLQDLISETEIKVLQIVAKLMKSHVLIKEKEKENDMKMQEIRIIAKDHGIKIAKLSKLKLIHEIQRAEGNFDCFATPVAGNCDQISCVWRDDCLALCKKQAVS